MSKNIAVITFVLVLFLLLAAQATSMAAAPISQAGTAQVTAEDAAAALPAETSTAQVMAGDTAATLPAGARAAQATASTRNFTVTVYTTKDTWVNEGSPTVGYSATTSLHVGRSGTTDYLGLLGFDISELPENAVVVSARLEMSATTVSGGPSIEAWAITSSWSENVSWNFRPFASYKNDPPTVCYSGWNQFDVTNIVAGWVSGLSANMGILLQASTGETGYYYFRSDESSWDMPRLVIVYTTQSSPMMFPVQKDTYIRETSPSTNYGSAATLLVQRNESGYEWHTFLGFDISDLPADSVVLSATLEMYNEINRTRAAAQPQAFGIQPEAINSTWNENSVTWNSLIPSTSLGDPAGAPVYNGWTVLDVTNIVEAWATGARVNYGIALLPTTTDTGWLEFYALPSPKAARLRVYYEPAPPPCYPATGVSISGPTQGLTDTLYSFSASVTPPTATAPFTYTWQATEQAGVITQNGTAFTITMSVVFSGTCDPAAWTFNVSNTDQGITTILTGSGEDQNSMAGNFTVQSGSTVRLRGVWSAELLNR